MACDNITIVKTDGSSYRTEIVSGASWYEKKLSSMGDHQQQPSVQIYVRIPQANLPAELPERGDLIIRGTYYNEITCIRDLQGATYGRVMSVSNNLRGGLPHIGVVLQ